MKVRVRWYLVRVEVRVGYWVRVKVRVRYWVRVKVKVRYWVRVKVKVLYFPSECDQSLPIFVLFFLMRTHWQ